MLRQDQRQVTTQRIDPKLIQANAVLQQSSTELAQAVQEELEENPALDVMEEERVCHGDCLDPRVCPQCQGSVESVAAVLRASDGQEPEVEPYAALSGDWDDDYDPLSNIEAELTLGEHLVAQLRTVVSATDLAIGQYLVSNLSDNGWLDGTVEGLAAELEVNAADVLRVLRVIQTLDPPGVGARDLRECLLIQLRFLREDGRGNVVAERLVRTQFEAVVSGRLRRAARALGVALPVAESAAEFIRASLNPYPAAQFRPPWDYKPGNGSDIVRPDVLLRRTETGYEVEVCLGVPNLAVSPLWQEAYDRIRRGNGAMPADQASQVTEYVERAETFIRNLNQRRKTLRSITKAIVDLQQGFLATGSRQFIRPLTRARVATEVGLHESTVSRATSRKFVQLPNLEVVSFDVFFNPSLAVRSAIEEIITAENRHRPLSDRQIVDALRERGFNVARRTVVKYREAQKLLSSSHRRA